MNRYAIIYSYATSDRYYRGQRATVVEAATEKAARAQILRENPSARILRIRQK